MPKKKLSARERELRKAVNKLKMSKEVKETLISIALEIEGSYNDRVGILEQRNKKLMHAWTRLSSAAEMALRRIKPRQFKSHPAFNELWNALCQDVRP